ncbi:MAG TPA: LacI family DNA-binding transcriptional regulator [Anaerolineae bacterium]
MLKSARVDARVTIADVAREAGVSRQTVSRVINNKGEISPETLAHVRSVIARLEYRPSSIARGLATQKTLTIGLVVPDIANPFFAEIARAAEDTAHAAGYSLLLGNTAEDQTREEDVFFALEDKRVDGVIICSSRLPDERLRTLVGRFPAAVLFNRRLPGAQPRKIFVDDAKGALIAVHHVIRDGRMTLAQIVGPTASFSARERVAGFAAGLAEAGRSLDPGLELACSPNYEGGYEAAVHLLTQHPEIDALLCYNDLTAAGALAACAQLGRRVPADVAVIGNDDIMLARLVTPPLTTLRVDKRQIGVSAMELLLAQINQGAEAGEDIVCTPELIVRASAP